MSPMTVAVSRSMITQTPKWSMFGEVAARSGSALRKAGCGHSSGSVAPKMRAAFCRLSGSASATFAGSGLNAMRFVRILSTARARRSGCTGCGHVWHQDLSKAAQPRARLSRGGLRWALPAIACQHLTVARVAEALGVAWNTANDVVPAEGRRVPIADAHRLDGVRVLGVDEQVWRHTRHGDKYAAVVIDLTGIRDGTGPARPGYWTWSRDGPSRRSRPGLPNAPRRGATRSRSWRWTASRLRGRRHRRTARGGRGHGPVPRRPAGRRRPGPVPPARAAGHLRAPRRLLYSSRRTLHTGAGLLTDSRRAGSRRCSRSARTSQSK